MLKVAIVGCGKIADAHASQIQRLNGCEIVGLYDREELMAKQLCERFRVKRHFSDLNGLLNEERPDVIHITTPPQSHFELARQVLQHGCHVYVEKPFTLNATEAEILIELANKNGLKITVGHDLQHSHVARRMRQLISEGYLGGTPVHMESYYCYDLGNPSYARALLADKTHWVRRLPGKLLHNIISHGVARIAEFFTGDSIQVFAHGFASRFLENLGEDEIIDELRVLVSDHAHTTAYFTFSSQMRPTLNQFRIYGLKNGLVLDQDNETLIRLRGTKFKSYAEHFISPLVLAKQYLGNVSGNVCTFLGNDFHPKAGMKNLMESFYRSITYDAPLPIPYREILLTARIMDEIFAQTQLMNPQGKTLIGRIRFAETGEDLAPIRV
jgi:predicted dehydrogenase